MNTINLALYAASIAMPNVNETNLPKCTIPVLNLFRGHELIGNTIGLGDGLNLQQCHLPGHPNTKDALVLCGQDGCGGNSRP
jgi:hypothetical protein